MLEDLLIPLVIVGISEFGDKTQLLILLMSSKIEKRAQFLAGIMLAFLITDGIAILIGVWITEVIPTIYLQIISGIVFILFGIFILVSKDEDVTSKYYNKNPFVLGFVIIMISEWGDKTQIAAGLFATQYNGYFVLVGVMIALTLLSLLAIYLGKYISEKVESKTITVISGILFILIGVIFILPLLWN
jgi:putative Ca2+/H+ antiporter (TMEM165/GDT1 family)